MNQPNQKHKSQTQDISAKDITVRGNFIIDPKQIDTYIETQIVEISAEKITRQLLTQDSPYKGLKRFNFGDRDYFFGRDVLIAKFFKAVNKSSFSLILGASGSGKSSVVRAGLIPELKKSLKSQKFYDFIFTPNQDPFQSLYRCLLSEEKDYQFSESEAKVALEARPKTLPQIISTLKKDEERWLLFIDQFEQLFTICTDLEKRKNFIKGIVQVAKEGDSSVRIVLAMRSDFLEQFSFYPTLGAIANQDNIHLVTEMYPDELRQAIEQPAAKNGVLFEKGLVEQIIKEVEGQKGYLPLLQYTLNLLWEKECATKASDGRLHIEDRTLNKTSYKTIEGVRGALQKRVDEIYADICEKNEDGELVTKQIFLKLVNIVESDSGSRAVSRKAYRYEFTGEPVESTLKRFIDENLLVSSYESSCEEELLVGESTKPRQNATVEIAHEILLSSWDKLKRWLEEEKEAIILKNWLAGETRRWLEVLAKDESKASDELLKGSRLEQIVEFREENAFEKLGGLVKEENQFIDASVAWSDRQARQEEERRQRELKQAQELAETRQRELEKTQKLAEAETKRVKEQAKANKHLFILLVMVVALALTSIRAAIGVWQQTRLANLRRLTAQPFVYSESQLDLAWLLGLEALDRAEELKAKAEKLEARSNLFKILQVNPRLSSYLPSIHKTVLMSVALSPDGEMLASASKDDVIFWDLTKQELIEPLLTNQAENNDDIVTDRRIAFNKDGTKLAYGGNDGTIFLWEIDPQQKKIIKRRFLREGHTKLVRSVAFSPTDSEKMVSGSVDGKIILWNVTSAQPLDEHSDKHKGESGNVNVNSLAFSPDGEKLASGGDDGKIILWDVETDPDHLQGGPTLEGHRDWILSLAFSPDGEILAAGDGDHKIILWNVTTEEKENVLEDHNGWVNSIAFSQNDSRRLLASGSQDGSIILWDVTEVKNPLPLGEPLIGHTDPVRSLAFSGDGTTLVSGDYDGKLILWDITAPTRFGETLRCPALTDEVGKDSKCHPEKIISIALKPEDTMLASASWDGTIILWDITEDVKKRKLPRKFPAGNTSKIWSIAFSKNDKILASGSEDGTITLWDLDADKQSHLPKEHKAGVRSLAFSPDGTKLVSGSFEGTVILWDVATWQPIRPPLKQDEKVRSVAFSPDGKWLATGSWHNLTRSGSQGIVRMWNVATLEEKKPLKDSSLKLVDAVAFSPDNRTLAAGGFPNTLFLWDVENRESLDSPLSLPVKSSIKSIAFSHPLNDRALLASGTANGRIILWDLATRRPLAQWQGHKGAVGSIAFSWDNKSLVSGGKDGKVKVWDVSLEKWQKRACSIANRKLTQEEWDELISPYTGKKHRDICNILEEDVSANNPK